MDVSAHIKTVLSSLGSGRVDGVAYDTAWVSRLIPRYSQFSPALDWLRENQHPDGSWGASFVHYHDRYLSTLSAIVALCEVGETAQDQRRIQMGERILWHLVGHLHKDGDDTVGFPLLAMSLTNEANRMGLNVPQPASRFTRAYFKKVDALINAKNRDWHSSTITYSLEGLRDAITLSDDVFEHNHSISVSPAATAAYLMKYHEPNALTYLEGVMAQQNDGSIAQLSPIDTFETIWALSYLQSVGAVTPDIPEVQALLERLWGHWSPVHGTSMSIYYQMPEIDDTLGSFSLLNWGGYPVNLDVFNYYEAEEHFWCFVGETHPSISANIRLLSVLKHHQNEPRVKKWVDKIVRYLNVNDENGSLWTDKWHASPYYVTSLSINILAGLDDDLAVNRLNWILNTQNEDGGWGYSETSTPEETSHCLRELILWHENVAPINTDIIKRAADYIYAHTDLDHLPPLWIGKTLYTPPNIVKASILSALYTYERL